MLKTKLISIALIVICTSAYGADTRPSERSIRDLMRVTKSQKLLDNMMVQFDTIMKSAMQQALKDQAITPKQQKLLDEMQNKMISVFKEEMNWKTLEPLYIKIYRDSFTQGEVDGMLAFYESPSGQAVIKKMPLVLKNTMAELQKRMGPILDRLIKEEEETIEKIKADSAQE